MNSKHMEGIALKMAIDGNGYELFHLSDVIISA